MSKFILSCNELKYSILVFLLLLFSGGRTLAQQDPMFTQYMHNPVSINPAYAGSRGSINLVAMARQQWVGIDGAPKTVTFSANSPFFRYNVGVGLSVLYDQLGPVKQTGIYIDYAYHLTLNTKSKLAFGIKGGINFYDSNLSNLIGAEGDDHILLNGVRKLALPNFGVGSYLYSDRYFIGLSIPKILENLLSEDKSNIDYSSREQRHLFLSAGVVFNLSENLKFKPSTTLRIVVGAPVSTELSGAFLINDKLWLGGMYRFGDSMGALLKIDISRQLSVGYSYDLTQSALRPYNQGTHEVFITYDVPFNNRLIMSPRYF